MNLKTIAQEAGVSTATVSNVINGNYHKVSQKTIQKIQKIIEENDYRPNATARSLASKESKIIGVIIPHVGESENFSMSPYNTLLLGLLENYVRRQGYYLMMRCTGECKEIIPLFSSWNVDGIILFGAYGDEVEDIRTHLDVPAVYIDTYADQTEIANVGIDDYKGGYLAARYLLGKGHRRIAFVGPDVNSQGVIQQRYQGFCDACAEEGVKITPEHIFQVSTTYQNGIICGQKIAISDVKFTAAATMSDIVAFGVMEGLRLCGLNIPGDVSVIGFDNLPECNYSNPKLTTISQKIEQKALMVGEYLFEMIREKKSLTVHKTIDVEIIERQSVKEVNTER